MDTDQKGSVPKITFLTIISYILAAYLFVLFNFRIWGATDQTIDSSGLIYLVSCAFFLLAPTAKSLTIGKILKFEAHAKKVEDDVSDFKEETRSTLQVYNGLITTISNSVNQSVVVNLPSRADEENAKAGLEEVTREIGLDNVHDFAANKLRSYLSPEEPDPTYALVKLRIELEKKLRGILRKRVTINDPTAQKSKFLSVRSLFRLLVSEFPKYKKVTLSFEYVLKVCNAAAHGQIIGEDYVKEALTMGIEILEILDSHTPIESPK